MRSGVLRDAGCVLFALLLTACATAPAPKPAVPPLVSTIDAAIAQPPFQHAFWSILVVEDDGTVLYSRNADKLTMPASNRKLFAAATITNCLGTETRLSTEIWREGEDLVIRGGGDPSLGSWRYGREDDFDNLAIRLHDAGIRSVRDVIADVSLFDRVTIPGGWKYGNLGQDYAAPVDALAWGENEIAGDHSVADPALYTATTLRDALVLRGVAVTGIARVNSEPRTWQQKLATLDSPFVGSLLETVLKNSHNLYAEMLFKRSALVAPASYDAAFALERAFLTGEAKVSGDEFRFVDGSGLAPDDLVAPEAIIGVLRWMNDPARHDFWWGVLAQPNNLGTLRRRIITLEHRMRGKTGTINGVNALSGMIAMPDGHYRYFSAIVNHHDGDSDEAMKILDAIAETVAR